jgi:hypothetical protein
MRIRAVTLSRLLSLLLGVGVSRASILDSLGAAHVFASRTKEITLSGEFEAPHQSDTLWADRILSGLNPNRYDYFVVRRSSDPAKYAFDIVFFYKDGRGVYVGIPSALVSSLTETEATFAFILSGGGEAGTVKTRRTISIKHEQEADMLIGVISEESITSSVWSGRKKEVGRAELKFHSARLSRDVIDSAMTSPSANEKKG